MKTEPKVPREGWFYVYRLHLKDSWTEHMGNGHHIDTRHMDSWSEDSPSKQLIAINLSTGDLYQHNLSFREVVHITSRPAWIRVARIVERRKRRRAA